MILRIFISPFDQKNIMFYLSECGVPDHHESTIFDYTGTTPGHVTLYACAEGYSNLVGDDQRSCQSNYVWSGRAPTCSPIRMFRENVSLF